MGTDLRMGKRFLLFIACVTLTILIFHAKLTLGSATSSATEEPDATPEVTAISGADVQGRFDVGGRSMYITCRGTGSPTIVLESGEGGMTSDFSDFQAMLAERTMTCAYDRVGSGQSDRSAELHTAADSVEDLHTLLEVAQVPGPYLLVGTSAGGLLVQLYGRTYPDQIVGVVSMNPVPPAHPWLDDVHEVFAAQEYADEEAYYHGENGEPFDYVTSSEQLSAAPLPPHVPFEMLISTDVQCEGDSVCLKSYGIYEQVMQAVTAEWGCGNFAQVASNHEIFISDPDAVVDTIERIVAAPADQAETCKASVTTG